MSNQEVRKEYNLISLTNICIDKNIDYSKLKIVVDGIDYDTTNNIINFNSNTYIKGNCSTNDCRGLFCRYFVEIYKYGGKCRRCLTTKKYTLKTLSNLNLQLSRQYYPDELHAHFVIDGSCLTHGCIDNFSRKFIELILHGGYCQKCCLIIGNKKKIITTINRFGVENISQLESTKKLKELTCEKNHGVKYATQSPLIQQRIIKTSNENWGTDRPTQNKQLLERISDDYENKTGFRNPFLNPDIKNKIEETNIQNLGCSNPFSSKIVMSKIVETNINKYGYSNPMQNPEILEKSFKNSHRFKDYIFPSGKITQYQGYENYGLDELLFIENVDETDIINMKIKQFKYIKLDGSEHQYTPDICIISQNRFIEVKSTYTITRDNETIKLKQQAVKDAGYKCEIWVYNEKGKKVECYI